MKMDITFIILTHNEAIHIQRCLENVLPVATCVYIVDCFSSDRTKAIVEQVASTRQHQPDVRFVEHAWPGNQAEQLNWALDALPITTEWVFRIDADEYLTEELKEEIRGKLQSLPKDVTGVVLKRRHIFLERWMRRGTYPVKLLRLFKYRKAICEQRLMDEHIQVLEGKTVEFAFDFVDHNLNNLSWWTQKHVGYAIREATDLLNLEFAFLENHKSLGLLAEEKQAKKRKYAKLPLFWRAFGYFCVRYFAKGGCLEGREGFLWHFLQGLWYRTLVDAKIFEIKKKAKQMGGITREHVAEILRNEYGMKV